MFHFGKVALDENMGLDDTSEYIHSDTLFSSLVNVVNSAFPDKTETFIDYFRNNEITISSAFYKLEVDGSEIYFLPTPVTASMHAHNNYKEIKKIKFVSREVWQKGYLPGDWIDNSKCCIIDQRFVCSTDEKEKIGAENIRKLSIFNKISSPKVKVHTLKQDDRLFNETNIQIEDNPDLIGKIDVHFYFLAEIQAEQASKIFDLALSLLQDTGIGGQRSTGAGFFEEILTKNVSGQFIESSFQTSRYCNLSLLHPINSSEFDKIEYYDFITRGGRHIGRENSYLKHVKMIKEGAICSNSQIDCDIPDISPDNNGKFLRNGKGIIIPVDSSFSNKN